MDLVVVGVEGHAGNGYGRKPKTDPLKSGDS